MLHQMSIDRKTHKKSIDSDAFGDVTMTVCQTADAIIQYVPFVVPCAQAHLLYFQCIDGVIGGSEGPKHGRIDIHFSLQSFHESFVGHVFLDVGPPDPLERAFGFFIARDEQAVHLGPQADKFLGGVGPGFRFKFSNHLLVHVTVQRMVRGKVGRVVPVESSLHVVVQIFRLDVVGERVGVGE